MANAPQMRGDKVSYVWLCCVRHHLADLQQVTYSRYKDGQGGGRTYLDEAGVTVVPTRAIDFNTSLAATAVQYLGSDVPCP
jgi:hypothetical protein